MPPKGLITIQPSSTVSVNLLHYVNDELANVQMRLKLLNIGCLPLQENTNKGILKY